MNVGYGRTILQTFMSQGRSSCIMGHRRIRPLLVEEFRYDRGFCRPLSLSWIGMSARISFALLSCVVMIAGCAPPYVTHNQLNRLRKGMQHESVLDLLSISPDNPLRLPVRSGNYTVEFYPLQVAQTSKTEYTRNPFVQRDNNGYIKPGQQETTSRRVKSDVKANVYFLYQDDRLRYWGMMGDFSKSDDPEVLELAPIIYTQLFLQGF